MKKSSLGSAVVLWGLLTSLPAFAFPYGSGNEAFDYVLKSPDLSRFSAGVYYTDMKRDIRISGYPFDIRMSIQRLTGYLGYDIASGVNAYAIVGGNAVELDDAGDRQSGMALGVGVSVNLLHHYLREPVPYEDAFRINAGAQFLVNDVDFEPKTVRWTETSAAVTFALVNHTEGHKYYNPESISLYAGPALSILDSSDFSAKTKGGFIGGVQVFFTDSFALDLRVEYFDAANGSAGINLRF